ncbi:MAG: riboflavin synthase [Bosea sp. (in: a-proteobacteria)]
MFTGLVSDIGTVVQAEGDAKQLRRYVIESTYSAESIAVGASIACSGICLTAVSALQHSNSHCRFTVEAAAETLGRTLAGEWKVGTKLNLERSLRVGDELGGHLVTGHVDGTARLLAREAVTDASGPWGPTARFVIQAPDALAGFIAEKGSICLDGVSLTVNSIEGSVFSVLLIPHTLAVTTFGDRHAGASIHLEVDLMARYAKRLIEAGALSK